MKWIRGPWWDGFWLLSGLPIGLVLLLAPPVALLMFFTLAVLLETGHSFSPIVLAWSHRGFRRLMLARPRQYIALPAVVFSAALVVGCATSLGWTSYVPGAHRMFRITDLTNPFPILFWIYWVWNIYHFGMQNFGVLSLYKRVRRRGAVERYLDMALCLGVTAFGMGVLPAISGSFKVALVCVGLFSVGHWLAAIGLCSAVSRHSWLFIAAVLSLGAVGFTWMIPTSGGNLIKVIPVVICARMGLGFVHFLYDRWLWRMRDPEVRATIGRALIQAT